MKKNRPFGKPALSRLSFSLAAIFLFLNIFPNETESIVSAIGENYKFDYVKVFFRKEVSGIKGGRLGMIAGKMEQYGDTLKAYIIMNDTSFSYIYASGYLEEFKEGKRVSRIKTDAVPLSININAALNPLNALPESTALSLKEGAGIKAVWVDDALKDSALFYVSENLLIDSIKVFRNDAAAMKSVYAYNNEGFPVSIVTIDYIKEIEERILNYNVKFKRTVDFGEK